MIRIDFVFSYWILLWFIFYYWNLITFNPLFALYLGIIHNTILLLLMIYYHSSIESILLFIFNICVIKILPIYLIYRRGNTHIKWRDIGMTIFLLILYIIWVSINHTNVIKEEWKVIHSLFENKKETPMMYYMEYLYSKIRTYIKERGISYL